MKGRSILRNFGTGKGLKSNGMSAAVQVLEAKLDKLYPNRAPGWMKIIDPCFAVRRPQALSNLGFHIWAWRCSSTWNSLLQDEMMYDSLNRNPERFFWMFRQFKSCTMASIETQNDSSGCSEIAFRLCPWNALYLVWTGRFHCKHCSNLLLMSPEHRRHLQCSTQRPYIAEPGLLPRPPTILRRREPVGEI